ncbi:cytochrome c oxidase assembly protein [Eionea flava]
MGFLGGKGQKNATSVICAKLGVTVVVMFVFAVFIMPPLYDLFCDVTGLNGKTGGAVSIDKANSFGVDTSRTVKVQFLATNNENMPWDFKPQISSVTVHPGEPTVINYLAKNTTVDNMVAQAIPSVVPFKAASYFHKTECFCFNQQPLAAGKSTELGLSFIVDVDIPKHIKTITLSYTLFDITDENTEKSAENNAQLIPTLAVVNE